jgi:16S rRNA (adenine1518-N6/adenine1519-N6)-dimethyltransferase
MDKSKTGPRRQANLTSTLQYTLKKSLGQHFLHDESICKMIVESINEKTKNLLEIGPGAGALTKYLIDMPFENYQCIEIDKEKMDYLHQEYPILKDRIIHDDFLVAELPFEGTFTIVGNFPYNISTQIVFKILDWEHHVDEMVGMFQKEVAQRIASNHGSKNYGIMSVITQCYYDVEYLFDVPASSFTPPPMVVSGVIRLTRNNNPYKIIDYKKFKAFVKIAFSQRRKTLRNCFKSYLTAAQLGKPLFDKRAEQLSVSQFVDLYDEIYRDQ